MMTKSVRPSLRDFTGVHEEWSDPVNWCILPSTETVDASTCRGNNDGRGLTPRSET